MEPAALEVAEEKPADETSFELCRKGDVAGVIKLLDAKPQVLEDREDACGQTLLLVAAELGNEALVKLCLSHGADITAVSTSPTFFGYNAVHWAANCKGGHVIPLLLRHGADALCRTPIGKHTPLMMAACLGNDSALKHLLLSNHGREINEANFQTRTPLWGACAFNRVSCVRTLLLARADESVVDTHGTVARQAAIHFNHDAVIEALDWWEQERERPYHVQRARYLQDYRTLLKVAPLTPRPSYLQTRSESQMPPPRLQLVAALKESGEQDLGTHGKRKWDVYEAGREEREREATDEERAEIVGYVVNGLDAHLCEELLRGLGRY